jgi:sulfate-transporting ATPase
LCLAVLAAVAIGVAKLRTSRLGSAMLAVKSDERAAAASGISVVRVKLIGFAIGAFIAGLGGCLMAYKQTNVTWVSFAALLGLGLFSTSFLAGITSVSGGLMAGVIGVGGIGFVWLDNTVDIGSWYGIVSGIGLIIAVIANPDGLVGPAQEAVARRRHRALESSAPASLADAPAVSAPETATGPGGVLSIKGLGVTYGGVAALDDVSIDVAAGSIVGIIGPNGAGKTTMIDAICGFATMRGTVSLDGRRLDGLPPHQRARRGLARTFQSVDLYEDLSVEENVVVGQYVARAGAPDLGALLAALDLEDVRHRAASELSQGQRQLVSIARALASGPQVLLLDEPAAGLDAIESAWLAERLRAVGDRGVTIVLIDHDMSFVLGLCDVIHVLDFGHRIASGPPDEIRRDPRVATAYLGTAHAEPEITLESN